MVRSAPGGANGSGSSLMAIAYRVAHRRMVTRQRTGTHYHHHQPKIEWKQSPLPDITIFLDYKAAEEVLRPIRNLCDPTRRYSFETYYRATCVEVRAIDCGPVAKTITHTPADAENRIRHD